MWGVWTGRRNIRLWQAATCSCSCFHSSEIIRCEAKIGCTESSWKKGPKAGTVLISDLQLGPPRSFECFPETAWQSPGATFSEVFHVNSRASQLGLDLLEQGAVFTTCQRWGRLLWEFRPNNTLHSSREGIMGHEVKRKKNPTFVNDAAWSDFDKATVNKIETAWANESPVESGPIFLWLLWWVGKEKS